MGESSTLSKRKRIMFVDDEVGILKAVTRLFMNTDYELITTESAEAALKILDKEPVDLVVSDMRMPVMDGYEFLSIMKERYPRIFRVILSGYADDKVIIKALQQNIATIYLLKPWDNKRLLETIDQIFETETILDKSDIFLKLNNLSELPSLEGHYIKLLGMLESNADISVIATEIEKDQSTASKVLRMANSAYYGVKTGSIKQALLYLGLQNIRNLLLSSSIKDALETKGPEGKQVELFWNHAAITNQILNFIYKECLHKKLEEVSQTAGLLHNLGVVFYLKCFRQQYISMLKKSQDDDESLYSLEIKQFTISHQEVGGYLLKWWGLPYSIVEAALFHHNPLYEKIINKELVCAVHLAAMYAWKVSGNKRYFGGLERGVFDFLNLEEDSFLECLKTLFPDYEGK